MCAGKFRKVGGGILEFSVAPVAVEESAVVVAATGVVAAVAAVAVATVTVAVAGGCNCCLL